jgi:hypothetical protein
MKNQLTAKSRKDMKNKMASVFGEKIKTLSPDLKDILLDDLVTALENRLNILNKTNQNTEHIITITGSVECETL